MLLEKTHSLGQIEYGSRYSRGVSGGSASQSIPGWVVEGSAPPGFSPLLPATAVAIHVTVFRWHQFMVDSTCNIVARYSVHAIG